MPRFSGCWSDEETYSIKSLNITSRRPELELTNTMPVVQDKYADKHSPTKSSPADLIPGGAIIRAINDNLNEHIEDTAENFKQVHSKLDGLAGEFCTTKADISTLKGNVSTLKTDVSTLKTDVSELKTDVKAIKDFIVAKQNA